MCLIHDCGKDLTLELLQSHLCTQHEMDTSSSIIKKTSSISAPFIQTQLYPTVRPLTTKNVLFGGGLLLFGINRS